MNRINAKGLLFEDIDELYNSILANIFNEKKMSREQFSVYLAEKEDEISLTFENTFLKEYMRFYTINFPKFHKNIVDVQKAIGKIYRGPFEYFFSYLSTCHVILKNLFGKNDAGAWNETDVVVTSLYSHLLRKADQIGILLVNGYEDAALIIWRTFYEYAITLKFLAEQNNDKLTSRFVKHQLLQSQRLTESYNKRLVQEGFDAIPEDEVSKTSEDYEQAIKEFGKEFFKNEYGWASGLPGLKERMTLKDLEEMTEMSRYRPFYIWASGFTHANFSVFNKVNDNGRIIIDEIREVAPQLEDLIDPMQITLAVLQDVNVSFLNLISDDNELGINTHLLDDLYMQLIEVFQLGGQE